MNLQYNDELPINGSIQWWGVFLCLYFLAVLEGDTDIVCAVDGGIIYQRMPVFGTEFGEHSLAEFK